MRPDDWRIEERLIGEFYREAHWAVKRVDSRQSRTWRMWMEPVPPEEELGRVLADLTRGATVAVGLNGRIQHSPECGESSVPHAEVLSRLKLPSRRYLVELRYPLFGGTTALPAHPQARVLFPEISARTFPGHPHLYGRNDGDSWACPLSPQSTRWTWGPGATLAYLDQVTIWILKSEVWFLTGGGIFGLGSWIGPDTSHDPVDRLVQTTKGSPCWCGEQKLYEECHKEMDASAAMAKLLHEVERPTSRT